MKTILSIIGFFGVVLLASESDIYFPLFNFIGLIVVAGAAAAGRMVQ